MHIDFSLNIWTVGVTVSGWLISLAVAIWKLGEWTAAMKALAGEVKAHEAADDERFKAVHQDIRETHQRIDGLITARR